MLFYGPYILADPSKPPKYALVRLPSGKLWSPSAGGFVEPTTNPADAVMDVLLAPAGTLLETAGYVLQELPPALPGEVDVIQWIDPATGKPTSESVPAMDAPEAQVAVAFSLAVGR